MTELKIRRAGKHTATQLQQTQNSTNPTCILEAFENIVGLAKDSNLDTDFFEKAAPYISYAAGKLNLTEQQTVLLALFVDNSENIRIRISELAKFIGCSTTRILRLSKDVDSLVDRHYLKASKSSQSISYRMPWEVIDALRNDSPYIYKEEPIVDTLSFFSQFSKLMQEKRNGEATFKMIVEQTEMMLEEIKETTFAKELHNFNLELEDLILFIFMTHLFVENNDNCIGFHDIENLYTNNELPFRFRRELMLGESSLFDRKLIEHVNDDGMVRNDCFKLTNFAKDTLLGEISDTQTGKSQKGLIPFESLPQKELVFNPEEKASVEELTSILSEERFSGVQQRLEKAGMRKGFCCLFYGAPGTGKTETVYQIARKTGRNIMRVDVDKIKSCWVGESEKNIKALFDRYRNICKNSDIAPILLFNEADAVLGVRMEGASRSVDKMENSLQNIILQEMESLEGIMIATTNLTSNLDKAFERRFLYKIRYEKPSLACRRKIWEIMLPGIAAEDADLLASRFDLSGGEIENIARKHTVGAILSGNETIDVDKISEICRKERISAPIQKVGF